MICYTGVKESSLFKSKVTIESIVIALVLKIKTNQPTWLYLPRLDPA